jgi:hypothetical protein
MTKENQFKRIEKLEKFGSINNEIKQQNNNKMSKTYLRRDGVICKMG